jgi:predicted ATPase/class 3 adenylate cyclase
LEPISKSNSGQNAPSRSERRLLTALCYDVVESTDLLQHLDVEDFQDLISEFQQRVKQAIKSRGGSILTEAGDGGVALFPLDMDPKDAASLAIYAGLEIVDACKQMGREKGSPDICVRIGIATSMALIRSGQSSLSVDKVTALALALATRLQGIAERDTVLVSQQTRDLARRSHTFQSYGVHQLKGFANAEPVWRVVQRRRDVDRFSAFGRLNYGFIGRTAELLTLQECWKDVVSGQGRIVAIEGAAGIGKSRLLREIRHRTRTTRKKAFFFQCLPGQSSLTLHPLLQALRGRKSNRRNSISRSAIEELFTDHDIPDPDIIDVFSFLLGAEVGNATIPKDSVTDLVRKRVGAAVRHAIERICSLGPAILAVEDVHWIDPSSKHMLSEIAQFIHCYPLLLIVTTRPPLAGDFCQLPNLQRVVLGRLAATEARTLILEMWPKDKEASLLDLLEIVDQVTGGIPLFIEEMCQWFGESSEDLRDQLTRATSQKGSLVFQSILDARLESLGRAGDVARAASVAGVTFSSALLLEVLPQFDEATLHAALDQLSEVGLVGPARSVEDGAYTFRHALIQETIYNGLLRTLRQDLNRQIFLALSRDQDLVPWISTAETASHAERAGLLEDAIARYVAAAKEGSARSAMVEARTLLERALALCEKIDDADKLDQLKLFAYATLGPVLTSIEGPGSADAQKLYEEGVTIARRRPADERASLFPIYWGWWFTGSDIDNKRAQALLQELSDVEDPEIKLQLQHCVWAIDFYLGRHESCITAVNTAMSMYGVDRSSENIALFGGHDAKVCGLSHRGLSEWLTGRSASALRSIAEARQWAMKIGHVGSIAHAYHNQAMLHCYRRDLPAIRSVIADFQQLAAMHSFPSLAATFRIFEGWCQGLDGNYRDGQEKIREGLKLHAELQTPEDYPVYCCMLAELLMRTGEAAAGLEMLAKAEAQAATSGHRYWLAELYHHRARLLLELNSDTREIVAALSRSLEIAVEQEAVPLLINAFDTLESLRLSPELVEKYRHQVEIARADISPDNALVVTLEETAAVPRRIG